MSTTQPTSVSVVVPLYYCDKSLFLPIHNCLSALKRLYPDFKLVVIDDASPLECPEYWPITSQNAQNSGFTATVNKGMSLAIGNTIVVLNDDITVKEGDLDWVRDLGGEVICSPMDTASSNDDRFGACWAITREAYTKLGPLNESYKHFWSDKDYYDRAKAAGIEVRKLNDVMLDHPESSTYKLVDKEKLLAEDTVRYLSRIDK
jgi:GT2 family glycosyltransferase